MPFTGSGTGIQNADDVFFSSLSDGQALKYNLATAKWNNLSLDKTSVGLDQVDNTADVDKPISTAQQTEMDTKQPQGGVVATVGDIPAGAAVGSLWVVTG